MVCRQWKVLNIAGAGGWLGVKARKDIVFEQGREIR